jgi:prepilin-type processing-associated H-X9-DG protein
MGLVGASVAASGSPVDELMKRLPDGVVGFAAAGGGDALKADFEKTSLGRIWNDPGVRSFYQAIESQLLAKMQETAGDPNGIKQFHMATDMVELIGSRPTILGVAQVNGPIQSKERLPVYAFAVVEAGTRKAELEAAVKKLEALAGADRIADVNVGPARMRGPKGTPGISLYWGWSGDYLVVGANDAEGAAMRYLQRPRDTIPDGLKKAPVGGDAIVIHADIQKTVGIVDAVVRQEDAKAADTVSAVLKELGLSGVKTFSMRAGFAGPDLVTGSFLEVTGPRTGLLTVPKPVDPALMDIVDARAVTAGAANPDVAGAYDAVMRAIRAASGEAYADVEEGLAAFESEAKLNIRKGLLESLAGPAIFYSLGTGTVAEAPAGGVVAVIKLKDADLFERTLNSLGGYAAAQSKGALQISEQKRDGGQTVHTWMVPQLAMLQVMPVWSVTNGYAVIGSNVGVHDAAIKQMASTGEGHKSIRDTAGYKEVASRLPENLVSLSYTDSRTQYTQAMAMLQQFWPMATMFAAQAGVKLPPTLPSLGPIIQDMKPSCQSCWIGPDGFYAQYRGPGIEVSLKSVAGVSLGMGVLMPALARTREQARQVSSMANLKQVGLGLLTYANDHDDKLPDDLKSLVPDRIDSKILESPRKPKDFTGPSYVYIAGQTTSMNPRNIVVYENPAFCSDEVNVLFMDGHVEFMKSEAFRQELAVTCKRLGREMPEIRFKDERKVEPAAPKSVEPSEA